MEEIKAGDIMIGNWVNVLPHNKPSQIIEIKTGRPAYKDYVRISSPYLQTKFATEIVNIKGIPLTEDILLKAGGYKLPHMTVTDSVLFDIGRDRILSIGCIEDCNQMAWLQHIEGKKVTDLVCIHNYDYDGWLYLHTFQNLFKSLTGNDLKIEV